MPRVYGFYCLQTIDLSFILVEVEGWGSQNCGCHICMTPNPELINCYVNFWSEICQTKMYENIWHEVFKNGPSMLQRTITFFKGCLPQNLLGPFLNTFPHTWMENTWKTSFFESLDKNFGPQQI